MSNRNNGTGTPRVMLQIFGIIMIVIYVGMGVLLMINFFDFSEQWAWVRWTLGGLFIIYGIWRAYRQIKGIDYTAGSNRSDGGDDKTII